jgi:hypothetical protein
MARLAPKISRILLGSLQPIILSIITPVVYLAGVKVGYKACNYQTHQGYGFPPGRCT